MTGRPATFQIGGTPKVEPLIRPLAAADSGRPGTVRIQEIAR
jgi:hypothetical protein